MSARPALTAAVLVAAGLLAGCSQASTTSGSAVSAGGDGSTPTTGSPATSPPAPQAPQTSAPARPASSTTGVALGRYAGQPRAEAAAAFYEQLWASYGSGRVSDRLDALMTERAAKAFTGRVAELRERGRVVNGLTDARVAAVDGPKVKVCMASTSHQLLEAGTEVPVERPEPGYTEYTVTLQRESGRWRVAETAGISNAECGE